MKSMKKVHLPVAIAISVLISSCSKDSTMPIVVAPQVDTLTLGWKKVIIDTTQSYLDVYFNNTSTGYLVGSKSYKSTDGGLNWQLLLSNESFGNLHVTANGNAFFAGLGLFKSSNGTGPLTNVIPFSKAGVSDVYFVDDNNGYYFDNSGLYHSTDAGANWTKLATTGLNFPSDSFSTLCFSNNNTGWISAKNTVYKTNGSTSNWVAGSFPGSTTSRRFASVFVTPNNTVLTASSDGELFKSTNGGSTFSLIQTFRGDGRFVDIHFIDNNVGYVSALNKIYKTTDGGVTWAVVATLANGEFIEIHFVDAGHGWASATKGAVLIYNN